jgi:uncharacterized protein involved in tolerance to divalent cations
MVIKSIAEIKNPNEVNFKPIKECMQIFVPDIINENISRRNGAVYVLTGSGGSGKSSLLLNMFKSKAMYRGKFHRIYYICPESSFLSVSNHPFEKHDKVYHELTVPILESIYSELNAVKEEFSRKKDKKKKKAYEDDDSDSDEEAKEVQYSAIIIDDFADALKNKDIALQLSKMIIKARHICCSFIFTLQSYYYMPKILRKQVTYTTIFKPKNIEEWNSISKELLNLVKDDALKVYDYVFDENYNHIDIDLVTNKYYKNFNLLQLES